MVAISSLARPDMYGNKCGLNGVSLCALIYVKTEFNINRLRNVHIPRTFDYEAMNLMTGSVL